MRRLVACRQCRRQFDASGMRVGSQFYCHCGSPLEVLNAKPHDADVVRCSSCGAPRGQRASVCRHCGSEFTLIEQDLNTVCPACFVRVSDHARFCHACATPLTAELVAGQPTRHVCPACKPRRRLRSRQLGESQFSVLECPGCAGLWIGLKTLDRILELDARRAGPIVLNQPRRPSTYSKEYRPCAVCQGLMPRRNFGNGQSGVVVDVCGFHGSWFDVDEFAQLLNWVRGLGHRAASLKELSALVGSENQRQRQTQRMDDAPLSHDWLPGSRVASPEFSFAAVCDAIVNAVSRLCDP